MKDEIKEILDINIGNDREAYIDYIDKDGKRKNYEYIEAEDLLDHITNLQEEIRRKDNIIYDLEDFIKEIMKATNKEIINIETAEIIYNKLKDLQGKSDE